MSDQTQGVSSNSAADLEVHEVRQLLAGARDSLSDDIVTRLSATVAESLDLMDRLNRSGVQAAIPSLAALTASGDLERLVAMARTLASAGDALSDDIVSRAAGLCAELLSLADRISRCEALFRLLALLESDTGQNAVRALEHALGAEEPPPAAGGTANLLRILRSADAQYSLSLLARFGHAYRNPSVVS